MAKQLYIGAATGFIYTKKSRIMVHEGKTYALDPSEIKGHEKMFRTADQQVDHLLRRTPQQVEQATAAPGEVRTTPPRKPRAKPAAAK